MSRINSKLGNDFWELRKIVIAHSAKSDEITKKIFDNRQLIQNIDE